MDEAVKVGRIAGQSGDVLWCGLIEDWVGWDDERGVFLASSELQEGLYGLHGATAAPAEVHAHVPHPNDIQEWDGVLTPALAL